MRNIVVLLAAGSGKRFEGEEPKQFLRLEGKLLLEYSMEVFQNHPAIDEIWVVAQAPYFPLMEELLSQKKYSKFLGIIEGGKERHDSTFAAISHLDDYDLEKSNILLHDAARPLITSKIIDNVITALKEHRAVITAIPATDTIVEVSDHKTVASIPDRKVLMNVQTPQGFRLATIRRAFEIAMEDPDFYATDDGGVVFRYLSEEPIFIVAGDLRNIKITYKSNLQQLIINN